jgi:hypothetical protein
MVRTDCAAATARLVHDGQARRPVLVEFASGLFKRFIHAATGGRGAHDFFNRNFRSPPVISRHATTHIALGDDADQTTAWFLFNHGRATASRLAHRLRGVLRRIARRAARIHLNWFHLVATTTHVVFLLNCLK